MVSLLKPQNSSIVVPMTEGMAMREITTGGNGLSSDESAVDAGGGFPMGDLFGVPVMQTDAVYEPLQDPGLQKDQYGTLSSQINSEGPEYSGSIMEANMELLGISHDNVEDFEGDQVGIPATLHPVDNG